MLGKCPWHAHSVVTCCNMIQDGCEQCKRPSLPTIFRSSKQSTKGVACEISKRLEIWNQRHMAQRAERVDVHACETLLPGLRKALVWPRNGLRSNLIASKLQKFYGGGGPCPQTPLAVVCLLTHHWPDHCKFDGYGPVITTNGMMVHGWIKVQPKCTSVILHFLSSWGQELCHPINLWELLNLAHKVDTYTTGYYVVVSYIKY